MALSEEAFAAAVFVVVSVAADHPASVAEAFVEVSVVAAGGFVVALVEAAGLVRVVAAVSLVEQLLKVLPEYLDYFFVDLNSALAFAVRLAGEPHSFVDFAEVDGSAVHFPVAEVDLDCVVLACHYPWYPCFALYLYGDDYSFQDCED